MLDFLTLVLTVSAVYKGWRKGLVVAVCSFFAFFIGLIAALTFSAKLSGYFQAKGEHAFWIPFVAFAIIMSLTVFLVRWLARSVQKLLKAISLGWLNRIAGILLYLLAYLSLYSIILFYASGISLISPTMIAHSVTYKYIQPWGPTAVEWLGHILPWFRDVLVRIRGGFEKWK